MHIKVKEVSWAHHHVEAREEGGATIGDLIDSMLMSAFKTGKKIEHIELEISEEEFDGTACLVESRGVKLTGRLPAKKEKLPIN
jgi:hypothetical protein